jgi:hypothetical protein
MGEDRHRFLPHIVWYMVAVVIYSLVAGSGLLPASDRLWRRDRKNMNHLLRELAPISTAGWQEIEREATRTLKTTLAARRLVDFVGPQGWGASAVGLGRSDGIPRPTEVGKGRARLRKVLPLVELRVPFEMNLADLDDVERGAKDPDTEPVIAAARAIAIAEDREVFHGFAAAGIRGICEAQAAAGIPIGDDYEPFRKWSRPRSTGCAMKASTGPMRSRSARNATRD